MRKKFLSAFMLGLLTLGATSTMTSCKDYDGDISSLKSQIASLEDLVNKKEQTINQSIQNLQNQINDANNNHATKAALQEAKDELWAAIGADYKSLVEKDGSLSAAIIKAQGAASAAQNLADKNKEAIDKIVEDLGKANEQIGTLNKQMEDALRRIGQLEGGLKAAQDDIKDLQDADVEIKNSIKELDERLTKADKDLKDALDEQAKIVEANYKDINDPVTGLKALHAENAKNIKANADEIAKLWDYAKKLGEKIEILGKALADQLSSLVFIPDLYVDGIETIEYPFLKDTALVETDPLVLNRTRTVTIDGRKEDVNQVIRNVKDWVIPTPMGANEVVYGPAWPVDYHINPAGAHVDYADVQGFTCRKVDVVTRALDNSLNITSPEKYDNGDQLFAVKNGIATVGIKLGNPKALLANWPEAWGKEDTNSFEGGRTESETGLRSEGKENIVALQIKSNTGVEGAADSLITSDYAMLQPEVLHPEAIVWVKDNARGKVGTVDEDYSHSWHWPVYTPWAPGQKGNQGVKCPMVDDKTFHVWDTPEEALLHTDGVREGATIDADDYGTPDLILPWNTEVGIDLSEYIGTHVLNTCPLFKDNNKDHNWMATWQYGDEKKWGLHYEFELVYYTIDGNATIDSRYAELNGSKIFPRDIDPKTGATVTGKTPTNNSVVGREPLVRVKLMTQDSKVLLDAYILIRIGQEKATYTEEIAYHEYEHTFDLCNATDFTRTEWHEFDKILDKLDIEKIDFDKLYELDLRTDWPTMKQEDGGTISSAKIFVKNADGKYVEDKYTDYNGIKDECGTHDPHTVWFGNVFYYFNKAGVNQHAFKPDYTEDELEYITHDWADGKTEETKTIYVRYKAKDASAKYSFIYVKFDITFKRAAAPETGIQTKDNNYWFAFDGNSAGWDAVSLNYYFPDDRYNAPTTWSNDLLQTFIAEDMYGDSHATTNHVDFTNEKIHKAFEGAMVLKSKKAAELDWTAYRKFFFAPINTEITDIHGDKWIITAQSSAEDEKWDAFVCHNDICCSDKHNEPMTPKGYDHKTWKADAEADYNKGMSEYRMDYVTTADVKCSCNLHKAAKYTTHKFATTKENHMGASDDAANSKIMQKCAIDYNDGVFTNNALYAYNVATKTYTQIAEMNQETGTITLVRPKSGKGTPNTGSYYLYLTPLDMVMNAIGYWGENHENISAELHTLVGVVANNGCGVAVDLFQTHGTNDQNYSIFQTSWQRPINLVTKNDEVWDADNNGDGVAVMDLIKLYDWRGPVWGNMEGAGKWLYGYYNVHQIKFNLNPAAVKTTLHHPELNGTDPAGWEKLSKYSDLVHLWAAKSYNPISRKYELNSDLYSFESSYFNLVTYAKEHNSAALNAWFALNKDLFGYIYYENNEANVNTFQVQIPVEVIYEWGHLDSTVIITIHGTEGNNDEYTAKRK